MSNINIFSADFETTTIEPVKVWAWGIENIETNEYYKGESIEEFINYCKHLPNGIIYFHNLKFDCNFIIHYLLSHKYTWQRDSKMCSFNDFTTLISDKGRFYSVTVYFNKSHGHTNKITFYDSLNIINMPIEKIAKNFKLPVQKGNIDYDRHNIACEVTKTEWEYLYNDVHILALILKVLYDLKMDKMTIGSCALHDYKQTIGKKNFSRYFPTLTLETDSHIRQSYKGGFTFVNPDNQNKIISNGMVFDVNSLYPYVMYEKNLPFGIPLYFKGKYKENKTYNLYIQNLRCNFKLKKNHIPTIQLKNTPFFKETEYLNSSYNDKLKRDELIYLSLTNVDLKLFFRTL